MKQTEDFPSHFLSCASFLGLFARWISETNPKDLWNPSSVVPELGPDSKLRFRTHKQFASTSKKMAGCHLSRSPVTLPGPPHPPHTPGGFAVCHLLCQAACCFLPVKTVWCVMVCSEAGMWLHSGCSSLCYILNCSDWLGMGKPVINLFRTHEALYFSRRCQWLHNEFLKDFKVQKDLKCLKNCLHPLA